MTYFNLRKREPEPTPDEPEEEAADTEEATEETAEEQPAREHGPLLTGLLGPGRWIAARIGTGWAFGVHLVAVWAVGFYGGWTAAGVIFAWLALVLLFIPREFKDRVSGWLERRIAPAVDEETDERVLVAPIAAVLWKLIGDAPGVHLKTLTGRLQEEAQEPIDKAAVRAKLGALGIPLRGSVRDAAGKVNEGVHRDDLEAWEEAPSPTGTGTPSDVRSDPCSDAVTSDVATRRTGVATPLSRLRRLLPRGGT
ncbi:hypothetical protein AB0E25_33355 [Streptomyces bobili]|uniref:hypothetical protein n=1 Tax=Streptomyces bobili TaxID=67280 RepID=UPI0033CA83CA